MSAISQSPLRGTNLSESPSQQPEWLPASNDLVIDRDRTFGWTNLADLIAQAARGIARRWRRELRRRKIGRAYDMALEIAAAVPYGARVLDVGCGNGFIAHHLSAMLGTSVTGIDLSKTTEARINYRQFDGQAFPVNDDTVDAVLFCYVLHHAQDLNTILVEARRALQAGGLMVIYEDIPQRWWDRIVCAIHNLKWRGRTGPCTFRSEPEWRLTFAAAGFELIRTRQLSRWRKLVHPVSRMLFVLRLESGMRTS